MRIKNTDTSRVDHFVAVDITDLHTRETSLTNAAVWYDLDGGGQTSMTAPTITHIANGVFKLAIDEAGMVALGAGVDEASLVLHITADEIDPVTKVIEVYRPKITAGYTLGINSDGDVLATVSNDDMVGTNSAALASGLATHDGKLDAVAAYLDTEIAAILEDTATTLPATLATLATAAALVTHDGKLDTVDTIADWLKDVAEGDSFIDITATPWQLVIHKKGDTGTEYIRKNLFQTDASNITDDNVMIGKHTEPA